MGVRGRRGRAEGAAGRWEWKGATSLSVALVLVDGQLSLLVPCLSPGPSTMDLSAQSSRADAAETASAVPSLGHGSSAGARHAESASASAAAPAGLLTSPSMPQLDVDNKPSRKSSFVADPAAEAPAYHPPVYHGCGFPFRARIYTPTHDQFSPLSLLGRARTHATRVLHNCMPRGRPHHRPYVGHSPNVSQSPASPSSAFRSRSQLPARADTGAPSPTRPSSPATSRPGSSTSTGTASARA